MKKRCRTCDFYLARTSACKCPKFVEEDRLIHDGLAYFPMNDLGAVLEVGPDFGCIHWEPKKEDK